MLGTETYELHPAVKTFCQLLPESSTASVYIASQGEMGVHRVQQFAGPYTVLV